MKKLVTVQDISCFGQCSITVALPILSAYGIETAILPSALMSTHTGGFSGFTCLDLTEEMPAIVEHWVKEGIRFDAMYTGYIGDTRQFDLINACRDQILEPDGLLIVDPAMADHGKLYSALDDNIVDGMKKIVRTADIILPNLTEAAFLLDEPYKPSYTKEETEAVLKRLTAMGPKIAILTGVSYEEGKIGAVAYDRESDLYTEYFTDFIVKSYHGTGDVFSSVVVASLVNGQGLSETLQQACDFVAESIKETLPYPDHNYGVRFEPVLAKRRLCKES